MCVCVCVCVCLCACLCVSINKAVYQLKRWVCLSALSVSNHSVCVCVLPRPPNTGELYTSYGSSLTCDAIL